MTLLNDGQHLFRPFRPTKGMPKKRVVVDSAGAPSRLQATAFASRMYQTFTVNAPHLSAQLGKGWNEQGTMNGTHGTWTDRSLNPS